MSALTERLVDSPSLAPVSSDGAQPAASATEMA